MEMTIDRAIARLQELRDQHGGDTLVAIPAYTRNTLDYVYHIGVQNVGKGAAHKVVSRGGIPVVVVCGVNS